RFHIPDVKGFYQVSGVQFKTLNLSWVCTDNTNSQKLVEQKLKTVLENFTFNDEQFFEKVIIGDSKPKKLSMAQINFDVPGDEISISVVRKGEAVVALNGIGYVTFVFSEKLPDAKSRRKIAAAMFFNYIVNHPVLELEY
ncbi:MAG TPA: hypothetical protein VGC02_04885, partial [Methanobacterium sp.]